MKSGTQFSASHSVAILCVGEPKTGKTRLMMSFPTPGIIDCDMNLNSAVRVSAGKEFYFDQPALDEATNQPRKPEDRWNHVVKVTKELILDPKIKTICVDGLGVLTEWLCDHIVNEGKKSGGNKTGRMELQNYGDLARLLRGYVMMLRASGKYIFVTSHQTSDKDELTGALRYALAIPGQSKETLGGLFTDVWATATRPGMQVKYEIRTRPTGFHVALGTSFDLAAVIDITDKTPDQIWKDLEPKLSTQIKK